MRLDRRSLLKSALGAAFTTVCAEPIFADTTEGSIQRLVLDAYHAKRGNITIPAGTYRITPLPAAGSHLAFHDMADFEIDARGVYFVLTDATRGGIEFVNCRNVRLHGATVRYEVPPFTQGIVESVAPDRSSFTLRIDKGYPTNFDDPKYFRAAAAGCLFDAKTRRLKSGGYDLNAHKVERLGPSLFRLYGRGPASAGDLAAFRANGKHNIRLTGCGQMELLDVTINNSGVFGLLENDGEGHNHYSVAIKRGPPPSGADTEPLWSTSSDGFHSTSMRNGPVLENCSFEGMPDDGIAICGIFSLVLEASGDKLVINRSTFRVGDPLQLLDDAGRPAGLTSVKSVTPSPDYQATRQSSRQTSAKGTAGPYFEIVMDKALPAAFDYLCSNPSALGSGYVLRNNTIRNNRARGMLLKAHNGLVEGNTIDGSSVSGIIMAPEFFWNEACYSHNVTLRNNTIQNLSDNPLSYGAIVLSAATDQFVPGYGHQHIVIESNKIININGVNLLITSAADVTVRSNVFINAQRVASPPRGAKWGEDAGALIYVTEAKDVQIEGNTVSGLGPANRSLVKTTSTARQIQSDWK